MPVSNKTQTNRKTGTNESIDQQLSNTKTIYSKQTPQQAANQNTINNHQSKSKNNK